MTEDLQVHRSDRIRALIQALDTIASRAISYEQEWEPEIAAADPRLRDSVRNLIHYLTLRNSDIREVQTQLAELGLSSLGHSEAHTLATLNAVRANLYYLNGQAAPPLMESASISFEQGTALLEENARALLGPEPEDRRVRIMVTLPTDAADDFELVLRLINSGMNVARINCAHDGPNEWLRMSMHVRRAALVAGRECKIIMDLAGPKIRTGPLAPGPRVIRSRPARDLEGKVTVPARVLLVPEGFSPPNHEEGTVVVPVTEKWKRSVQIGDEIRCKDARDKKRTFRVASAIGEALLVESEQTTYFKTGMRIFLRHSSRKTKRGKTEKLTVGELEPLTNFILLHVGDLLFLSNDDQPGSPAVYTLDGDLEQPARISCEVPEIFKVISAGERILFDDGKIEGIIRSVEQDGALIEITSARKGGSKLQAEKGINLPDNTLPIQGLTQEDREHLDLVITAADTVALSFVNSAEDVAELQAELARRDAKGLGILVKIETQQGFEELPLILLQLMRSYPVGVMIARGDLAVELGWQRMAEVQEEILWLCEAAHLPTVWATQVLEALAQTGIPSRAEITDAAMAERAECVMLNKGPFILDAISTLGDILTRMEEHQTKKTPLLRRLNVSDKIRA